jgi:hypothetical protein
MTTINCSSNCIHQQDGKCTLENASTGTLAVDADCVFFEERPDKAKIGVNCKTPGEL